MTSTLVGLADRYLAEYAAKIERATAELPEAAFWWRTNERSNSIGNLILHLHGNLSLWILSGLAGEPFVRRRSTEFSAREALRRADLLALLSTTVERSRRAIRTLSHGDLSREREIQTYTVDGYSALFHAVEHTSYHTGQIVLLAKQLLPPEIDLEFYPQHRDE